MIFLFFFGGGGGWKERHIAQLNRLNGTGFHLAICKKIGLLLGSFREEQAFDWR